ncbi:hypothetical protein [Duffyella gerundensis]|uniref:hypothetical protein n=1 Tax=Duffyella gerundensis TaxID=1619313 RepID=UPI003FCF3E85
MTDRMKIHAVYQELNKRGHLKLWFKVESEPEVHDYIYITGADECELAWWDSDSRSWFLDKAAEIPGYVVRELKDVSGDPLDLYGCDFYQVIYHC